MAHYVQQSKCVSMVGSQRRFSPAMTALKARVEERGPIHSVSVANLKSTRDLSRPGTTGVLDQLTSDGMHAVHTLRWLAGGDVERVAGHVRVRQPLGPVAEARVARAQLRN